MMRNALHRTVTLPAALLLSLVRPALAESRDGAEVIHGLVLLAVVGSLFLAMVSFALWLLIAGLRVRRQAAVATDLRPTLERLYAVERQEAAPAPARRRPHLRVL